MFKIEEMDEQVTPKDENKFLPFNTSLIDIDSVIGEVLAALLIHSINNPHYLETADYITRVFNYKGGSFIQLAVMNICYIIDYYPIKEERLVRENFDKLRVFLWEKYGINDKLLLQRIKNTERRENFLDLKKH